MTDDDVVDPRDPDAAGVLWWWRSFVSALASYEGDAWAEDVVRPWLVEHPGAVTAVTRVAGARDLPQPDGLYCFSRAVDVLLSAHQPWGGTLLKPVRWGRTPSRDCLDVVMTAVGARPHDEPDFHPFFHEVVEVEEADDPIEEPSVVGVLWPAFFVDGWLVCRAGVRIRAGSGVVDPTVATRTPLLWSWYRLNRPCYDLSYGWGHNSQWRTDVRRDYWVDGMLHYNVDESPALQRFRPEDWQGAPLQVLRHRSGLLDPYDHDHGWPWSSYDEEPYPAG